MNPLLKGAIPIFLPIEYPHKNRIDIPIPSETYFAVKGSFINRKGIVIGKVALNPIQKIIIPPLNRAIIWEPGRVVGAKILTSHKG